MPSFTVPPQFIAFCRQRLGIDRWLRRNPVSAIGLDVGSASVKAVLAKAKPKGFEFLATQTVPIAAPANPERQAKAIREALQGLPSGEADMVAGIGGPGTVLRSLLLPRMNPGELKGALTYEAEKYIPFKLEEVFLDVSITGHPSAGQMEVVLAAARRDLVHQHLEVLAQAGVVPQVLDLDLLALANAWEAAPPAPDKNLEGATALLHVGARATILDVFLDSRLQFAREIPLAGDAFTKAIADSLQLDAVKAERIKCGAGDRADEIREALRTAWEEWLGECRRSFDFYESQHGHRVERLVLSGGSARFAGFPEWVQEATGLPTEAWAPTAQDPGFGVAAGLAARGVMG